jgi:hypothetical protein
LNGSYFKLIIIALTLIGCAGASREGSELENGFQNPPASARPRVWWHWMNGNITKEGIRADLEWMHRIGIAGFQNFDAAVSTPQIVQKRLVYMTPDWKDAFSFTTKLADSLGLEMAIAGSPGWSESGGPWVKPKEAMKKYVWSETRIDGGKPFTGILAKPPTTTGPFQNLALRDFFSYKENQTPEYYADEAIVAYKLPDSDSTMAEMNPKVTSSGGKFSLQSLSDGDLSASFLLPFTKPGENSWVMFEFPIPETIKSLTIVGGGYSGPWGRGSGADPDNRNFEYSKDGKIFTKILHISLGGVEQRTLSFAPVSAKYFRFTWVTPKPSASGNKKNTDDFINEKAYRGTKISELILHKVTRVERFEEKAAFSTASDLYNSFTPQADPKDVISKRDVINLTAKMKPDGSLDWTPPPGKWVVIRLGSSLTGYRNRPASAEATGLEVDKLSAVHVRSYFTNYLDQYKNATGGMMGDKGLHFIIMDSWEAGTQNWTDSMFSEFSKKRGYDMLQWLPVLTGHIVESSDASDGFLWDFRKTIAELTAENHYDLLTQILKERGMERYSESHESGRAFIADGMEVKRKAAIPMSATWVPDVSSYAADVATCYKADVRESASVSHLYGQNLVAAESMTAEGSAWCWSPELLKPTADMELSNGLNRFVIHTSVHQPVNDKIPGLGLGPYGQWFTRHETWAEQAAPWITYLSRSSFMLQQGQYVADLLYYYGEDNNITSLFSDSLPKIPEGYNYDFINSDALLNLISVKNNFLVSPSGMQYKVLMLDPNSRYMTLPVLKKISELVRKGAIVFGNKPIESPSLHDDANEFKSVVSELWKNENGKNEIEKGSVFSGLSIECILSVLKIEKDFSYTKAIEDTRLLFVHRKLKDIDIYWINSRNSEPQDVKSVFRVYGRSPEIWHPETGKIEQASYTIENKKTTIPLHLEPNDALFVVFRHNTSEKSRTIPVIKEEDLLKLTGPWEVKYQENRGAPAVAKFDSLTAWNENMDKGIKYFSGTASYFIKFKLPAGTQKDKSRIWILLGKVKNLAEVKINNQSAGIVWKPPFTLDITDQLRVGENLLEIKVTNLWVNRLIGDLQPGNDKKYTYTSMPFYKPDSPLKPSGLLGPVVIYKKMESE